MNLPNLITLVVGSLFTGGVLVKVVEWIRGRKLDRASASKIDAEREVILTAGALDIVKTLREQLELDRKERNLLQQQLNEERENAIERLNRIEQLQDALTKTEERCREMAIELEQLRVQIKRYQQGRP